MSDVCTCCGYDHGCQDSIRIAELEAELKEAQTVATTALQRELELKAENKQLRSALEDIAWNMAVGEGGDSYEMRAEAKAALAEKNNEL